MKKLMTLVLMCNFSLTLLFGQNKQEKRWDAAIASLNQSDFVEKYDELKTKIEEQVKDFQVNSNSSTIRPEDVLEVKKAYDETVVRFDAVLQEIKKSFTDPQTRQVISTSPERFTRYLESEIEVAFNYYNNNCKRKMDAVMPKITGAIGLMEFGMLITLGKEVYGIYKQYKENTKKMSGEYFDKNFVKQHQLKRWEEY